MNQKHPKRVLWLLMGAVFGVSLAWSVSPLKAFSEKIYSSLEQFSKVLFYVENEYVEPVNAQTLLQGAIKGMLGTLDPHTMYLSPDVYKELKVDTVGRFGGVGLEVSLKDGILTVVSPIEGTPAAKAGIEHGDRILKIDNTLTKGMDLSDAVKKMRGSRNSKVHLTIIREGWKEAHEFKLTRENINVKSVKFELLDGKYAYARITNFQERTSEDLLKALTQMEKSSGGLKGIIIDLRNDPGGLLDQAVEVSDLFIKEGVIVSTKSRNGNVDERKATGKAIFPTVPMAILINGGSASASEIVAGALQDYGRAYLIGTQSFGKGSVQTVIDLGNDAGLKLTVARYFTPKNRQIDGKGITPDQIVKLSLPETRAETNPAKNEEKEESDNFPKNDNQKKAALDYLKKVAP